MGRPMGSTIEQLIAKPMGVDYLTPLAQWQGLGKTQAETGLIQQQATGAGIENQLKGLNLARMGWVFDEAGIPHPPVGGQGAGGVPGGGLPGGTAPVGGAAAGTAAPSSGSSYPGEMAMKHLGQPLPPLLAATVMTAADPSAALKTANETRRQTIFSTVSGSPPEAYPQAMEQLFRTGYITPDMMRDAIAHPEGRQRIMAATQNPEAYQSMITAARGQGLDIDPRTGQPVVSGAAAAAKGALAQSESYGHSAGELPLAQPLAARKAAGAGEYDTVQITAPDPDDPTKMRSNTVRRSDLPGFMANNKGARPTSSADLTNPDIALGPGGYADRVRSRENGGGQPGAVSATSNATGDGQFIPTTWLDVVRTAKPAWAQGMTEAQILAQRASPAHAAEMSYAYAQQNAPKLAAAGLPVNSLTLGMAHQFGPDGVTKVLDAKPTTPMSQIVSPAVLAANPQLRNQTAAQANAAAFQHYGVNQVDLTKPFAAPPTPVAPGAVPGLPVQSPQQVAGLDVTKRAIEGDEGNVTKALGTVDAGQKAQTQLLQVRDLVPQINAGSFAEAGQRVQNYLATFAPEAAQRFAAAITAGKIDPSKAGATQEFVKLSLQQAGAAERDTLGARGGLGAIQLYQKAFPNLEMQPAAIKDMTNLLLIAHQRDIDYGQGANTYFQANRDAFTGGGQYNSLQKYDGQFQQSNPPQVYVAAAAALNGKPFGEWANHLTPQQQQDALRILWRADPAALVLDNKGQQRHSPAMAR